MAILILLRAKHLWIASSIAAIVFFGVLLPLPLNARQAEQSTEQEKSAPQEPHMEADPSAALLDTGFHQLYELNFEGARADFISYQKLRPDNPMGKVAEAASYLFEEFNSKGVLTSAFFLDENRFLGGVDGSVAQNKNPAFIEANHQSRELAKKQVKANPRDTQGLMALTISDGMESNYNAFIEKKQLPALTLMRQAESEANVLLAIDPTAKDAYVALGMANYVIGSLPSYKRAFLWFGGVHGDKARGMQQMKSAAEEGRYLKPFAQIMLALAYEREKQPELARPLLTQLTAEFPRNPIFAKELALLDHPAKCCKK